MPLWISFSNWMPSSLDMHFIIMPLVPHRNKMSSMRWCCLDLCAIRSTSTLSSDSGWFSRNILIRCIQLYAGSCSGSSIIIRSCLIASFVGFTGLIEGIDNLSIMTSGGVGALEEAIYARWSTLWLSSCGAYTELQTHGKTSPFFTLLLGTRSSSHYYNRTLSALTLLPAVNHLW
jgi:hypothetical protein